MFHHTFFIIIFAWVLVCATDVNIIKSNFNSIDHEIAVIHSTCARMHARAHCGRAPLLINMHLIVTREGTEAGDAVIEFTKYTV